MKANFKAVVAGTLLTLVTISGCGSTGENAQPSGANAQKFASVLSPWVSVYPTVDDRLYELGVYGYLGVSYGLADVLKSYQYRDMVALCKNILDELNLVGEPDADIAPLVQETNDAFAKCQTQGPATDFQDFYGKYLGDVSNVWGRWIPYGVPEIER